MADSDTPSNLARYTMIAGELASPIIGGGIAGYFAERILPSVALAVLFLMGGIFSRLFIA